MSIPLPLIPSNIDGNSLINAINDRLRRIAAAAGAGTPGAPGAPGSPGGGGGTGGPAPGDDTQIIYNAAGHFAASPLFVFDYTAGNVTLNNGPGTGFRAPVFNSLAVGTQIAITQKDQTFHITGAGDAFFQTVEATTVFKSNSDNDPDPANTAAFQTSGQAFIVYGTGDVHGNTFKALTVFNSLADLDLQPAQAHAFQTSGGNFIVFGDGLIQGQKLKLTTPLAPIYGGTGISTIGTNTQVLIGGTPYSWGKVDLATMVTGTLTGGSIVAPGVDRQVIFNKGGPFGTAALFEYNYSPGFSVLRIGAAGPADAGNGVQANTFSAFATSGAQFTNGAATFIINADGTAVFATVGATATGSTPTFSNTTNSFWVTGAGSGFFSNQLHVRGAAGTNRALYLDTASIGRWIIQANATAETGGNAGSDYAIASIADNGTAIGTPFFIYRASGRVGIGTTTPAAQLHVIGPANGASATFTDATQSTLTINHSATPLGNSLIYTVGGTAKHVWQVNSGYAMCLTDTGLVGIGHTTPTVRLHVIPPTSIGVPPAAGTYGGAAIFGCDSPVYGLYVGALNTGNCYLQAQRGDSAVTYNLLLQPNGGNVAAGGEVSASGALAVNGAPGTNRIVYWRTNGVARWAMLADGNPETGGNAGSHLSVYRCNDAGTLLANPPININRTTNLVQTTALSVVGNLTVTANLGVGTASPVSSCHIFGSVPVSPPSTVTPGGALFLDDSNATGGSGGMIMFGAGGVWRFAAIRGAAIDGTPNTRGDIVFYTRRANADATLTEAVRILSAGNVAFGGPISVFGQINNQAGGIKFPDGTVQITATSGSIALPVSPANGGTGISTLGDNFQVLIGGSPNYSWGKLNLGSMVQGFLAVNFIATPGQDTTVIFNESGLLSADPSFAYARGPRKLSVGSGFQQFGSVDTYTFNAVSGYTCNGQTGRTFTFNDQGGTSHSVVGGIIVS